MDVILNFIKGIGIGAGAIIPGVSSGVLCVIFGIYEKLINSILGFFQNWKKNLLYLLPIVFGGMVGIVLFSNILEYFFIKFPTHTQYCFIGLILGCLPVLFKTANSFKGFRLHYFNYLFLSFGFTLLLIYLEIFLPSVSSNSYPINYNTFFLILSGFCMSIGVIIPGVSSTVILMLLGVYELYLSSVAMVNMHVLVPMGIGLAIGSILFMKLSKYYSENILLKLITQLLALSLDQSLFFFLDFLLIRIPIFLLAVCFFVFLLPIY